MADKKKTSLTKVLIISIPSSFLIFLAVILLLVLAPAFRHKVNVAFYNLSDSQVNAIKEELETITTAKGKPVLYNYIVLDPTRSLAGQQNKKQDMLFSVMGRNVDSVVNKSVQKKKNNRIYRFGVPATLINGTTLSVTNKIPRDSKGNIAVVPLLLDPMEIDINSSAINGGTGLSIHSWKDIESFAYTVQDSIRQPISFAGSDDANLLNILGCIVESMDGTDAYKELVNTLKENYDYDVAIPNLADTPGRPLYNATNFISRIYKSGILNSECFRMTKKDIEIFMESNLVAVVPMLLSDHRAIKHRIIQRYRTLPEATDLTTPLVPSTRSLSQRNLMAHIVCAVPLSKDKYNKTILEKLISVQYQEKLSVSTGLGPVLAACDTPDIQADDARYWIATSNDCLNGLSEDAFMNDDSRSRFAKALVNYIMHIQ